MMTARWLLTVPVSCLVFAAMPWASSARAQTAGGAERYMNSVQSSIGRTNGMIGSIAAPSFQGGAAQGLGNPAMQSVNRANGMMQSMNTNRAATMRGMQQQVVHRTPDNLHGVYWNMQAMREAQMHHVQNMQFLREMQQYQDPAARAARLQHMNSIRDLQLQAGQARREARSAELNHRAQQRVQPSSPHEPAPRFDTNQSYFSQAHRVNQGVTITAPTPVPQNLPRRPSGGN